MAHIFQRKQKHNNLMALIPRQDRKAFVTNIGPTLDHKSACYKVRALALTYYLIGIPIPLIARIFGEIATRIWQSCPKVSIWRRRRFAKKAI